MNQVVSRLTLLAGCLAGWLLSSALAQSANLNSQAYPSKSTDCYVQLTHRLPDLLGGDYPVCRAVLANFNKFCDEPPQYNRRKLHSTTRNLREPQWVELSVNENLDLVRQTFIASTPPQSRQREWDAYGKRVLELAKAGTLRLYRADIQLQLSRAETVVDQRDGKQTVYKLENVGPPEPVGYDQPFLMFSNRGEREPAPSFTAGYQWVATPWEFDKRWYLIGFEDDLRQFSVSELGNTSPMGPVVAAPLCAIQHIHDR